jgi:hypothetical protein
MTTYGTRPASSTAWPRGWSARALEKERTRLESELELARRIQRRLLPEAPPEVAGLEIAGQSEPAREVGGDYYDHFDLGGGRVLLVIADVSGKGVPAALLMSGFRASLMSQDANALAPDQLAGRCNEFLHRSVETGRFVTAFLGMVDAASGKLVYANAGHNPPALLRGDGRIEWLSAGGLVLGIFPQTRFESGEATLERGDLLALYTDGVTEGADASGELWGEPRLEETLRRLHPRPCAEIAAALVREVRSFEAGSGPADDITVLLARRVWARSRREAGPQACAAHQSACHTNAGLTRGPEPHAHQVAVRDRGPAGSGSAVSTHIHRQPARRGEPRRDQRRVGAVAPPRGRVPAPGASSPSMRSVPPRPAHGPAQGTAPSRAGTCQPAPACGWGARRALLVDGDDRLRVPAGGLRHAQVGGQGRDRPPRVAPAAHSQRGGRVARAGGDLRSTRRPGGSRCEPPRPVSGSVR